MRRNISFASALCAAIAGFGCHSDTGTRTSADALATWSGVSGSRWSWFEAECNDGPLDLGQLGFDRALSLDVGKSTLALTFETELAAQGCSTTAVWLAKPGSTPDLWRFEPQAIVTLPADAKCGALENAPTEGTIHVFGDELELSARGSPWCRGFDARFVYRRVQSERLTPAQVVMRYTAAFNRKDADAMAALFVDSGALIEPFTRTDDGNYKRHEGKAAVRAWYESAFASAPWLALRLLAIEPGADPSQVTARWDYMDAHLAEPLHGRNLFVIAGGEIYESELQLLDDPKAKPEAEAAAEAAATPAAAAGGGTAPALRGGASIGGGAK